eukprot:1014875-Pleurochrysis_carterae.AAC.1
MSNNSITPFKIQNLSTDVAAYVSPMTLSKVLFSLTALPTQAALRCELRVPVVPVPGPRQRVAPVRCGAHARYGAA